VSDLNSSILIGSEIISGVLIEEMKSKPEIFQLYVNKDLLHVVTEDIKAVYKRIGENQYSQVSIVVSGKIPVTLQEIVTKLSEKEDTFQDGQIVDIGEHQILVRIVPDENGNSCHFFW